MCPTFARQFAFTQSMHCEQVFGGRKSYCHTTHPVFSRFITVQLFSIYQTYTPPIWTIIQISEYHRVCILFWIWWVSLLRSMKIFSSRLVVLISVFRPKVSTLNGGDELMDHRLIDVSENSKVLIFLEHPWYFYHFRDEWI